MAERAPCMWLTFIDDDWHRCSHPVILHHVYIEMAEGHHTFCHGCPCHEPEPVKDTADVKDSLTTQPDTQRTDPPKTGHDTP